MTSALTAAIRLARLAETRSVVETREDILETRLSEGESQTAATCEVAGRQGFEPRYRGPEAAQTSSMILGRVVFVRTFARIVGPSPVGGGPFACKVSRFFQESRIGSVWLSRPAVRCVTVRFSSGGVFVDKVQPRQSCPRRDSAARAAPFAVVLTSQPLASCERR